MSSIDDVFSGKTLSLIKWQIDTTNLKLVGSMMADHVNNEGMSRSAQKVASTYYMS